MKKVFLTVLFSFSLMIAGGFSVEAAEIANIEIQEKAYAIKTGAVYYESSVNGGSGRKAVVDEQNPYTDIPCYASITGYSYLDGNGEPILHDYCEVENNIDIPAPPEGSRELMLHFHTADYRNGWVNYEDVEVIDMEELTKEIVPESEPIDEREMESEEVVEEIKETLTEAEECDQKTVVAIDFSGSMADNQAEVIRQLEAIEFGENTVIIVWAEWAEVVTYNEVIAEDFYVGGATCLMKALNRVGEEEPDNLILISDLVSNMYEELEECDTIKNVTIYDPDDNYYDSEMMEDIQNVWTQAIITRTRIAD